MCGNSGCWGEPLPDATLRSITRVLAPRGPDAEGVWSGGRHEPQVGHRRLSIIDVSDAGRQPMVSRSGRFVLVYNGEVYNHDDIRRDLAGPWKGHSDTETLLEACEEWGLERTLTSSSHPP